MGRVRCPYCKGGTKRFGKTKAGSQRWRCLECGATFTRKIDNTAKLLDMFLGWLLGGRTQDELPVPARTFRHKCARFWSIWPLAPATGEVHRVVFVDGIYLARNVVVLTQPAGYRKGPAQLWPFRPWLRGLPAVEAALARRSDEYNRAVDFVEEEEKRGAAFVFRPPAKLPIGRLSRSRRAIQAAYDIGRETAVRRQAALRDWLGES